MSFSQSRITNDLQQWNVNFKLVHLTFDTISHSSGARGITKCLGQFQYCSVHATNFLLNLLCIYVRKWTFKAKQNKNINVIALYKALFVYTETKPRGILTANQRTPLYHKEPMRTRSKYKLKSAAKCWRCSCLTIKPGVIKQPIRAKLDTQGSQWDHEV